MLDGASGRLHDPNPKRNGLLISWYDGLPSPSNSQGRTWKSVVPPLPNDFTSRPNLLRSSGARPLNAGAFWALVVVAHQTCCEARAQGPASRCSCTRRAHDNATVGLVPTRRNRFGALGIAYAACSRDGRARPDTSNKAPEKCQPPSVPAFLGMECLGSL